jgi:hypothetical protein
VVSTTTYGTQQRREALARADEIRLGMSAVRKEVYAGQLSLSQALFDERAQPMRIGVLLDAQWRWGPVKTRKFLHALQVGEHRRVRELTSRQIEFVAARLAGRRER